MAGTMTAANPNRTNGSKPPTQAPAEAKAMEYIPLGGESAIKLNVPIVRTLCSARTKSGAVATEDDALKFMMLCQARRLNPFEGDAFLVGFDGKDGPQFSLITAHQAFLKRAEMHPEYDGMKSGVVVEDADGNAVDREGDFTFVGELVLGGWACVYFKHRKVPMYKRLAVFARRKKSATWDDDTAGMICKCAEADALRSAFPTMLAGMYLAEERFPLAEVAPSEPRQLDLQPGRQKIGGTRKPATTKRGVTSETPEVESDPAEFTQDDGAQVDPTEPTAEDLAKQDAVDKLYDDIATAIDSAEVQKELTDAGAKLKASLSQIGEERHKELMGKWQAKFAQLNPKK